MEPRIARLTFAALSFFFLGTTFLWIRLDHTPPSWDDAFYLTNSLTMFDALVEGGLPGYARRFLTIMGTKPPLIAVLPTPVYLLLGRNPGAAYAVNLAFLLVMFTFLYRLAKQFSSARAGLLAVYIVGTMPILYGLARWYLVDLGLTAIVCVAMAVLAETGNLDGPWNGLLLGIVCGFGLLMKLSFPLYILVPMVFVGVKARRSKLLRSTLLSFALSAALLALPWYLVNFGSAINTALDAGSAQTAKIYFGSGILSPGAISNYVVNLFDAGPPFYFLALALLILTLGRSVGPREARGLQLCLLWLTPIIFLAFGRYRELRYAAPLFPAIALALAILVDSALRSQSVATCSLIYALLSFPALGMLQRSFGGFGAIGNTLSRAALVNTNLVYARLYDRSVWPYPQLLSDLYSFSKFSGGERKSLLIGTDTVRFNADIFKLHAAKARLPFEIGATAYEREGKPLLELVNASSYFIYREGGERLVPSFNASGKAALQEVRESGRFIELPISRTLPDGGAVHVFANRSPDRFIRTGAFLPTGMDHFADCNVTFAGKVQLTGVSLRRASSGFEVRYRWRCLRPLDRDYWCFTHVVDQQNRIAGYLDHQILNGEPPMATWKEDDVAIEQLRLPSVPMQGSEHYRLRLGLFHRASGERLSITASDFPLADDRTAAMVSEASIP